ncbi:MAG: hypothetical protein PHE25_00225 [Candidatus Gracilibacteria bacterium]|nr:hypothetical protein [Candidatus Gracilibacteria bacterium]
MNSPTNSINSPNLSQNKIQSAEQIINFATNEIRKLKRFIGSDGLAIIEEHREVLIKGLQLFVRNFNDNQTLDGFSKVEKDYLMKPEDGKTYSQEEKRTIETLLFYRFALKHIFKIKEKARKVVDFERIRGLIGDNHHLIPDLQPASHYIEAIRETINLLRSKYSGITKLPEGITTIIVPNLYARPDFISKILSFYILGQKTVGELLEEGKINIVFSGNIVSIRTDYELEGKYFELDSNGFYLIDEETGLPILSEYGVFLDQVKKVRGLKSLKDTENFIKNNYEEYSSKLEEIIRNWVKKDLERNLYTLSVLMVLSKDYENIFLLENPNQNQDKDDGNHNVQKIILLKPKEGSNLEFVEEEHDLKVDLTDNLF